MELSKANFVFSTKVPTDDENFVTLRELDLMELEAFQKLKNETEQFEHLKKLFPICLIDSSYTIDGKPATGEEIAKEMEKSSTLYTSVITNWINDIPFTSRLSKKEN